MALATGSSVSVSTQKNRRLAPCRSFSLVGSPMQNPPRKMTVPGFRDAAARGQKLTMLTAYDYLWAGIMDEAGVDSILVGDSLAMIVQGRTTTLPVTLDQMIYHGEVVVRAVQRALVIVDMPYMSYQVSPKQAVRNAGRIIKETGADAVKLEGGAIQSETIRAIGRAEVPVMAHVGMRPQAVRQLGGMGKIQRNEQQLLDDARAAEDAGAFGVLLELVPEDIAGRITESLSIPTIGIGAGPKCSGQVLVGPDMLGLNSGFHPKFLKHFGDLRTRALEAVRSYVSEVQTGQYPDAAHSH
jgi:3-methyl-2-oxobutanoate hydroxymethyltransferase